MENKLLNVVSGTLVNLQALESLTGITYKTLRKRLAVHKVKPKENTGKGNFYDPQEAFPALYVPVDGLGTPSDLATEQARLAKARTEKTRIETEKMMGTLIDKDEWCKEWSLLLVEFKDKLMALPLKLVTQLNGKKPEVMYEILNKNMKEILNDLADDSKAKADAIELELSQSKIIEDPEAS